MSDANRRARNTGRSSKPLEPPFAQLPRHVYDTDEFAALSFRARSLLLELALQYKGRNNGKLCASHSVVRQRGFRSKDQLSKALRELTQGGWILLTRQGGLTKASWYALTYRPIDALPGLEVKPGPALNLWRKEQEGSRDRAPVAINPSRRGFAAKPHRKTGNVAPSIGTLLARIAGNSFESRPEPRTTASQFDD